MGKAEELDKLIQTLYASISGPAGQPRQWDILRGLFFRGAHMIRTSVEGGVPQALVLDVEEYIENTKVYFQEHGFYENEIARRVDEFGNIAQVFSTYEARHSPEEAEPSRRGINSIQMFHDGQRWWIMNMLWDNEREDNPLPAKYSP